MIKKQILCGSAFSLYLILICPVKEILSLPSYGTPPRLPIKNRFTPKNSGKQVNN
jgi:hypothetical protein